LLEKLLALFKLLVGLPGIARQVDDQPPLETPLGQPSVAHQATEGVC